MSDDDRTITVPVPADASGADDCDTALLRQSLAAAIAAEGTPAQRLAVAIEAMAAATSEGALRHAAHIAAGRRAAGAQPIDDAAALREIRALRASGAIPHEKTAGYVARKLAVIEGGDPENIAHRLRAKLRRG